MVDSEEFGAADHAFRCDNLLRVDAADKKPTLDRHLAAKEPGERTRVRCLAKHCNRVVSRRGAGDSFRVGKTAVVAPYCCQSAVATTLHENTMDSAPGSPKRSGSATRLVNDREDSTTLFDADSAALKWQLER